MNKLISKNNLAGLAKDLGANDKSLSHVFDNYGAPPLWDKPENFATLIDIILGQQVSLASAKACFDKLESRIGEITPANFLSLNDDELKSVGFSRQKTAYGRNVANAVIDGSLDLVHLRAMSDRKVKSELERIKGIGKWTSDIYLLMAMRRPDVMPKGDLALHIAWQQLAGLDTRPGADEFLVIASRWKPFRSVAARLLWHFYLSEIRPTAGF